MGFPKGGTKLKGGPIAIVLFLSALGGTQDFFSPIFLKFFTGEVRDNSFWDILIGLSKTFQVKIITIWFFFKIGFF